MVPNGPVCWQQALMWSRWRWAAGRHRLNVGHLLLREVQQAGGGTRHGTYTTAPSATISHVLSSQSAGSARIAPVALPLWLVSSAATPGGDHSAALEAEVGRGPGTRSEGVRVGTAAGPLRAPGFVGSSEVWPQENIRCLCRFTAPEA